MLIHTYPRPPIHHCLFRSRPKVMYRRELLTMPDGGTVSVDWDETYVEGQVWSVEGN